jgi:hypothetical protein
MGTTDIIESRRTVLRLAAEAPCDPRTAERALRAGAAAIRPLEVRARVERAAASLGILLPGDDGPEAA